MKASKTETWRDYTRKYNKLRQIVLDLESGRCQHTPRQLAHTFEKHADIVDTVKMDLFEGKLLNLLMETMTKELFPGDRSQTDAYQIGRKAVMQTGMFVEEYNDLEIAVAMMEDATEFMESQT